MQINFDESTAAGKIVIRHDLDETLDQMKWTYANLEPYLANVKIEIPDYFPASAAKALNIVYFPQLGFLLSVNTKANDIENAVKDFQHPYTFQVFSNNKLRFGK
jgi:DNA mismatch repair protein MSH5